MKLFTRNMFQTVLGITLIAILAACGNPTTPTPGTGGTGNTTAPVNGKDCKNIGVLLPETASSERWDLKDKPLLTQKIEAAVPGAKVIYSNAEGDATKQQNQADAALTQGACILVIAAYDGEKAAAIVAKAKTMQIPVIAYDRLIHSKDLSYYVSFDNVKVGELQGQYIVDHYKEYVTDNKNLVMINGAQTDNNAILFKEGAMSKLQALIDSGELVLKYDQFTPDWDNDRARTQMEGALTANQNNIQIAYVANDGMANSVIAALKAKQLSGKVLVTGQDATVAGIQNIITGDQMMTVYKAIEKEAQSTANLVKALHDGTDTATLTAGKTTKTKDGSEIPSVLETPVAVDKTNILTTVVADNYVTLDQVCANLPAGAGQICP